MDCFWFINIYIHTYVKVLNLITSISPQVIVFVGIEMLNLLPSIYTLC